jgi:hypothetical protein
MVSCQEPSPLKGSKHSLQCHPHDAALVNALSFVSMGVEARCHPSKSTAHLCHMNRQPFLVMVALTMAFAIAIAVAISVAVADSAAVAVAIAIAIAVCSTPAPNP